MINDVGIIPDHGTLRIHRLRMIQITLLADSVNKNPFPEVVNSRDAHKTLLWAFGSEKFMHSEPK